MNSNSIGAHTEGRVLAALLQAGYVVAIPFGVARYDLVIETPKGFKRVQCKTGRLRSGAVVFNTYSLGNVRRTGQYSTQPYQGSADLFGVYCPDTDKTYLVPVDGNVAEIRLRVDQARNGQQINVRWAVDYEMRKTHANDTSDT